MKKPVTGRALCVLLCLALLCGLCGCAGGSTNQTEENGGADTRAAVGADGKNTEAATATGTGAGTGSGTGASTGNTAGAAGGSGAWNIGSTANASGNLSAALLRVQAAAKTGGIPEDAEGRLGWVRDRGVLRVATEPYFAPQEFIDGSLSGQERFVGADMEMARMIAARMGVELEIVPMNFTDVLNAVSDGECDLAISALAYTPGRAGQVELSRGYYYGGEGTGTGLLIRVEDAEDIRGLEDLGGRRILAQQGSLQESLLAEKVHDYAYFRRVPGVKDVYTLLHKDMADVAAVDIETAQTYLEENSVTDLMLIPGLVFARSGDENGDRIAARKGETELIAYCNVIIEELLESGQYDKWYDHYNRYASWIGL